MIENICPPGIIPIPSDKRSPINSGMSGPSASNGRSGPKSADTCVTDPPPALPGANAGKVADSTSAVKPKESAGGATDPPAFVLEDVVPDACATPRGVMSFASGGVLVGGSKEAVESGAEVVDWAPNSSDAHSKVRILSSSIRTISTALAATGTSTAVVSPADSGVRSSRDSNPRQQRAPRAAALRAPALMPKRVVNRAKTHRSIPLVRR